MKAKATKISLRIEPLCCTIPTELYTLKSICFLSERMYIECNVINYLLLQYLDR